MAELQKCTKSPKSLNCFFKKRPTVNRFTEDTEDMVALFIAVFLPCFVLRFFSLSEWTSQLPLLRWLLLQLRGQ